MKKRWQELVVQNPMLIEITRFRRRHFSFRRGHSTNGVMLALMLICYVGIVLVVYLGRESVLPTALIQFETGVMCLLAPLVLYQSISGERERRSWDLLLAAPISKSQIVAGKFIGATVALLIIVLLFAIPIAITVLCNERAILSTDLMCALVSFCFVCAVSAMTILFSARVKRSLMALGASFGTLALFLIVLPILSGSSREPGIADLPNYLNPFYVLARIAVREQRPEQMDFSAQAGQINDRFWGWPHIGIYIGLTVVLLVWASMTLNFAENEVKFLPKGHQDA